MTQASLPEKTTAAQLEVAEELVDSPADAMQLALLSPLHCVKATLAQLKLEAAGTSLDLSTTRAESDARKLRRRCVAIRSATDAAYEKGNQPLLEAQRHARRLVEEIKSSVLEVEKAFDAAIKAREARKAEEKRLRDEAERALLTEIGTRIAAIADVATALAGAGSAEIQAEIERLKAIVIDSENFGPLVDEAGAVRLRVVCDLAGLQAKAAQREQQRTDAERRRAELAAQKAELQRERDELAAQRSAAPPAAEAGCPDTPPVAPPAGDPAHAPLPDLIDRPAVDAIDAEPHGADAPASLQPLLFPDLPPAELAAFRPSDDEILTLVADTFDVPQFVALSWIETFCAEAQHRRLQEAA